MVPIVRTFGQNSDKEGGERGGGQRQESGPGEPPVPGGGGWGSMPTPVANDPACAGVSRRLNNIHQPWGWWGGMWTGFNPPPCVFVHPGALPALVTPAAVPRMLPFALRLLMGGPGRAGRAVSTRPACLTERSCLGCAPPPFGDAWGGGGLMALPGVARTRALPGALVASRALLSEIVKGGACAC